MINMRSREWYEDSAKEFMREEFHPEDWAALRVYELEEKAGIADYFCPRELSEFDPSPDLLALEDVHHHSMSDRLMRFIHETEEMHPVGWGRI